VEDLKEFIQVVGISILAISVLIASIFIAPILIGLGVILAVYIVVKLLNEDSED
jgi:predicted PurR-regulated permease PerM